MTDTYFLFAGIILALIGGLKIISQVCNSLTCSQKITAKITNVITDKKRFLRGTYPHYPVVTYTAEGKEYTVKSDTYTRINTKYKVGQDIVIRYNTKKPKEIKLGCELSSYIIGTIIFVIGIILIAIYCIYL